MEDPEPENRPGWKLMLGGALLMPLGWVLSYFDNTAGGMIIIALILFIVGAILAGINVAMVMVAKRSRVTAKNSPVASGIGIAICAILTTAAFLILGVGGCIMMVPFNLH